MNQLFKLCIAAAMILCFSFVKAQSAFKIHEVRQFMSRGEQNGIEVVLNGTNQDDARDALEKWAKKMKAKVVSDKKNPEIFINQAQIPMMSNNAINMYAIVTPVQEGSKVTVFSDLGSAFVSSSAYGTQYAGLEAVMKKFALDQAVALVEDQQKAEEKILKTMSGDLKDLTKKKDDYLKDIEKAKAQIQQREQDIAKNEIDQHAKQQQILLQQQKVETVKSTRGSLNY